MTPQWNVCKENESLNFANVLFISDTFRFCLEIAILIRIDYFINSYEKCFLLKRPTNFEGEIRGHTTVHHFVLVCFMNS